MADTEKEIRQKELTQPERIRVLHALNAKIVWIVGEELTPPVPSLLRVVEISSTKAHPFVELFFLVQVGSQH